MRRSLARWQRLTNAFAAADQLGGFKKNYQQPWFQYLEYAPFTSPASPLLTRSPASYFLGTQITRADFEALKAARKQRLHPGSDKKTVEKAKDSDEDDERPDPNLVEL